MTLGVPVFRDIRGNSGYIKAEGADNHGANAKLTRFSTGILGKVTVWLRKQSSEANRALRTDFVNALRREYGEAFLQSKECSALLGDVQKFKTNSKPLALRLVRKVIANGDSMKAAELAAQPKQTVAKLNLANKDYNISLSYKDAAAMHAASTRFLQHAKFDAVGSAAIRDISFCLDLDIPNKEKLAMVKEGKIPELTAEKWETLKPKEKALLAEASLATLKEIPGVANFVQVFAVGNDKDAMANIGTKQFKDHCLSVGIDPNLITTAASSKPQIPMRLPMLFDALVKESKTAKKTDTAQDPKKTPDLFEHRLGELLEYVPRQIDMLKKGIDALSDPKIMFKGISDTEKQTLVSLKSDLEAQIKEFLDPDGLAQHILAFATQAALDPTKAKANLQALLADN